MAEVFENPFSKAPVVGKDGSDKTVGKLNADDILKVLDDETPPDNKVKEPTEKEEEVEDTKDDETEEDDKDKIELKEDVDEEEEKLELDTPKDGDKLEGMPPSKKAIIAKYPEFFKEFPFFDKMMFRDKAYTEMFGSFDEAKEIFSKVERLNEFETQALSGDTRDYLSSIKENDSKAFDKIVDSYLKQLYDVDPEAYKDVTDNFAKQIIYGMAEHAKKKNDADLDKAAKLLHEFLFDTDQWSDVKVRSKIEKNEEKEQVENERKAFLNERFETARDGLTRKVDNVLKATISEYIDPRQQMTNYERKNAVEQTLKRLHAKIGEDVLFRKNLDKLWKSAFGDKFSEGSLNSIRKTYLGKASRTLASVIKDVRSEVLKDNRSSKSKDKDDEQETPISSRKDVNAGRPHRQENKANTWDRTKQSAEDFLTSD